ncbi:YaaA family protein [Sulfurospirillum sp. T05]|uniref:YaaA family protein n=1 Tax=Sulfurospirillum tamanense TaxID=2813362 RepID=A0ABS2WPF3_9BACT|nr:YaaA family protein [Sulfurospirillum tamanensis]MBE0496408.1 YaaA family protein [Campylobacterales bacterium]MBN2963498.1 YaaA family protein [Sulfurospirillum tamanensis]
MYILFSPSEAKNPDSPIAKRFSLAFPELSTPRDLALSRYLSLLENASSASLSALFGVKKADEIQALKDANPLSAHTQKALLRYTGVGYTYLDPASLPADALHFLENHLIIFSNLFGPLLGGDTLPYYKLKQGQTLEGLATETLYKPHVTPVLDAFLEDHFVVDLRAGFYEKFYLPNKPYVRLIFLKEGKVVSHWAKAWRGKVARTLALLQPQTEEAFQAIAFEGLKIEEIQCKGIQKNYFFSIME